MYGWALMLVAAHAVIPHTPYQEGVCQRVDLLSICSAVESSEASESSSRHGNLLTWVIESRVQVVEMLALTLQGVLSPKDARSAVDAGVDGLVLSNHGGRQLDHSPAPLDMIASVRRAIGHRVPLLMDGGIRRGTDVLKVGVINSLASGAHQKSGLMSSDQLHCCHPHIILRCVCAARHPYCMKKRKEKRKKIHRQAS